MNNTWQERFDALVNYDGFWGEEHPDPKNTLYMTDDKGMYSWPESQYELDPHKVKQFIERELEKAKREAYEEIIEELMSWNHDKAKMAQQIYFAGLDITSIKAEVEVLGSFISFLKSKLTKEL